MSDGGGNTLSIQRCSGKVFFAHSEGRAAFQYWQLQSQAMLKVNKFSDQVCKPTAREQAKF